MRNIFAWQESWLLGAGTELEAVVWKPGYMILSAVKTLRLSPKGKELQCCLV